MICASIMNIILIRLSKFWWFTSSVIIRRLLYQFSKWRVLESTKWDNHRFCLPMTSNSTKKKGGVNHRVLFYSMTDNEKGVCLSSHFCSSMKDHEWELWGMGAQRLPRPSPPWWFNKQSSFVNKRLFSPSSGSWWRVPAWSERLNWERGKAARKCESFLSKFRTFRSAAFGQLLMMREGRGFHEEGRGEVGRIFIRVFFASEDLGWSLANGLFLTTKGEFASYCLL